MNYPDYIFEIPVYSVSEKKYYEKFEKAITKQTTLNLAHFKDLFPLNFQEEHHRYLSKIRERLSDSFKWRYNEIVGYIGIYVLGNQIRAEYSYTEAKRIVIKSKKTIIWIGKLFERSIYDKENSEEIFEILKEEIELVKKEKPFKKRFIDTSILYKTGRYINWSQIMKKENIFNK